MPAQRDRTSPTTKGRQAIDVYEKITRDTGKRSQMNWSVENEYVSDRIQRCIRSDI